MPPHLAAPVPPGAARMYSVVCPQPHGLRLRGRGPRRAADHCEQVLLGGAVAQVRLRRDHERPQIEAVSPGARHPGAIGPQQCLQRREEVLLGQRGHGHPARRLGEPAGMVDGPEQGPLTVRAPERLQAFENRLAVVQCHGGRVQRERGERPDPGVVPAQLAMPPHSHHVIGVGVAEPGRREQFRPPLGWDRLRTLPGELQRGNVIHANSPSELRSKRSSARSTSGPDIPV